MIDGFGTGEFRGIGEVVEGRFGTGTLALASVEAEFSQIVLGRLMTNTQTHFGARGRVTDPERILQLKISLICQSHVQFG